MARRIVATAALPYANGDIHLGHLVEYLQADFWTRFQKMNGNECLYICADDTHGTPIMIEARKRGTSPEELIKESHRQHSRDFSDFEVSFDNYSSTNTEENRVLCEQIYKAMKEAGYVYTKPVKQLYDEKEGIFLPDRFVKGTCPKCDSQNQYGDTCDNCGATYQPTDLKDARSAISGEPAVEKESEHIFFKISGFKDFLQEWVPEHTPKEIANKLKEWTAGDLRDWDISRDKPYFGFEIPDHPGKYFYVWVDAPVGYIASTWEWCKKNGRELNEFWKSDDTEIYHFIGKDIVYFHTLFWPCMLKTSGFRLPDHVFVHGFLTVNGEKMSKSKGTFIKARTYLDHLDPIYLRYYYACKLSHSVGDIDLNLEDFTQRVNSDLIGKITNLASRGIQMLTKRLDGKLSSLEGEGLALVKKAQGLSEEIAKYYEKRDFSRVISTLRELADDANRYFDENEPWNKIKEDPEGTRPVLTAVVNVFRLLTIYLTPILPSYSNKVAKLLNEDGAQYKWSDTQTTIENKLINNYEHLATRIEKEKVEAIVKASQTETPPAEAIAPVSNKKEKGQASESSEFIEFDDFMRVDLRVARIESAEVIPEADKLLRLKISLGELGERQVIAGIKSAYSPEDLVGRLTVVVANLKPRKMKFGMSEAMVLAAGAGGKDLFIFSPDSGAKPGQRVK